MVEVAAGEVGAGEVDVAEFEASEICVGEFGAFAADVLVDGAPGVGAVESFDGAEGLAFEDIGFAEEDGFFAVESALVVFGAFLGVCEDVVGLGDAVEGFLVAGGAAVGVVFGGEGPVGVFNNLGRGGVGDFEEVVEGFGHGISGLVGDLFDFFLRGFGGGDILKACKGLRLGLWRRGGGSVLLPRCRASRRFVSAEEFHDGPGDLADGKQEGHRQKSAYADEDEDHHPEKAD